MMKSEFEEMVGFMVSPECYKRIEEVYVDCPAVKDKLHISRIYKKHDMNGIEILYRLVKGNYTIVDLELATKILRSTV